MTDRSITLKLRSVRIERPTLDWDTSVYQVFRLYLRGILDNGFVSGHLTACLTRVILRDWSLRGA